MATQRLHTALLVSLWLIVHSGLLFYYGLRTFEDSKLYLEAARFLVAHGHLANTDQWFYSIPITCLAAFSLLTPEPSVPFVIFQCLVSGLAVLALYRTAGTIFGSPRAGLMSAMLYILWWDMIHWNTAVMTESLAASGICFLLYTLVHFRDTPGSFARVLLWTVVAILTRPTGIPIALGVLCFFAVRYRSRINLSALGGIGVGLLFAVLALVGAHYMFTHWDFTDQYRRGNIVTYADTVIGTSLYHPFLQLREPLRMSPADTSGLPRILWFIGSNPGYFFKAMALKIAFLLSGMRPYYSTVHNAFTLCWNVMVYALFIAGVRQVRDKTITAFAVSTIVLNILLVGISSVDWDNRFLLPVVPPLVLLAGGVIVRRNRSYAPGIEKYT